MYTCITVSRTWWGRSYSSSVLLWYRACRCPRRPSPHSSPDAHWDRRCTPRSTQPDRYESAPGYEHPAARETPKPRRVYILTRHAYAQSEWVMHTVKLQRWLVLPGMHRYGWQLTSSRQPFLLTWHRWLLGQGLGLHGWMTSSTMLLPRELGAGGWNCRVD